MGPLDWARYSGETGVNDMIRKVPGTVNRASTPVRAAWSRPASHKSIEAEDIGTAVGTTIGFSVMVSKQIGWSQDDRRHGRERG